MRNRRIRSSLMLVASMVVYGIPQAMAADRTVPVGSELDVRLQTSLSSKTSKVEDRFEATTLVDYKTDGEVLIPAGSVVRAT